MLPEIGATELLVIAAVALIVVGPKDLPMLLRKLGRFMAKVRGMAADFRASFDEMARQSELDELRKEVEAMRRGQMSGGAALEASEAEINQAFHEIDEGLRAGEVQMHPPMGHQYADVQALPSQTSAADTAAPAESKPKPKPRKPRAAASGPAKAKTAPKGARKPGKASS